MFSLSDKVKEQFSHKIARLSDTELQNHQKVVAFKDSINNSVKQGKACGETKECDNLNEQFSRISAVYSALIAHIVSSWLRKLRLFPVFKDI